MGLSGGVPVAVAVDGKDAVGIFGDHVPPLVEAEGPGGVPVSLGAVDDFGLVDFPGKVLPDNGGQLHPHADVHLVVLQLHPVFGAPGGKELAPRPAHGEDDLAGGGGAAPLPVLQGDLAGADIHIGGAGAGEDLAAVLQALHQPHHGVKVAVRTQVLQLGLLHMQIVLETELFQLVIGGVPLGGGPMGDQDAVRLLDILQHHLPGEEIGEPAAVFGADDILAVGEGPGAPNPLHNGAAFAPDAPVGLPCHNGTFAVLQGVALLHQADLEGGVVFGEAVGHQPADAAADDEYIVIIFQFQGDTSFIFSSCAPARKPPRCALPAPWRRFPGWRR